MRTRRKDRPTEPQEARAPTAVPPAAPASHDAPPSSSKRLSWTAEEKRTVAEIFMILDRWDRKLNATTAQKRSTA